MSDYKHQSPGAQASGGLSNLTPREQEIARLYSKGQTSKEIADELCVSPTTVRNHVSAIYRKLEISNKIELINLVDNVADEDQISASPVSGETIVPQVSPLSATERALATVQAQQQATNEVLRVISHSPGDLDAVFDVILDYALRLSHSQLGVVYLYDDGGFKATGLKNVPAAFHEYLLADTIVPSPGTGLGRMARQHRIIHIHDVCSESLYREGDPLRIATVELGGARSFLAIPMIHRDSLIGAFTIYRQEVKPFTDDELSLLQGFSDQAAIALTITSLIEDRARLLEKLGK
ncbi:MAG: GAF domain-containing protein [Gammaproteobacteria bacterium]|nr:GAF domain-containing protein [Gammaproteobacteria bacterium]